LYHSFYEESAVETQLEVVSPNNATFTNSTGTKFTEEQLLASVGTLFGIFALSFTLSIVNIERKYVKTFFSAETGHAKTKRYFLEGKGDFTRSIVLQSNARMWTSIRPQVADWLDENWDKWEREKPEWFRALFRASLEDDIMSKRALAKEEQKAGDGSRRRSSLLERLSVRMEEQKDEENSESDDSDEAP
jgi:hypothetical protein